MPTFSTPAPISAVIELGAGDLRVIASDRADTVVEIRPTDPAKADDVAAAEHARVECANGNLLVRAQKTWKQYSFRGSKESIDVEILLPSGSNVEGASGAAAVRCQGRLGECRFKAGVGDVRVEHAGRLQVKTGAGDITIDRATGKADISTGSGVVRLATAEAGAVVKDGNGDIWLGDVTGDLRVSAANGEISVDRSTATVVAKSSNGSIRLGEVAGGPVTVQTATGSLEVGIRNGVEAWMDLRTQYGKVYNDLEATDAPGPGAETVEVRARTAFGDISVYRSAERGVEP